MAFVDLGSTIDLTVSRPKATTINSGTINYVAAIEQDGDDIEIRIYNPIVPSPATFTVASCTTVNGSTTVTAASGSFSNVRLGDAVTGTGIAASTEVTAKTDTTITLSNAATASGTVTLTITPPSVDATVFAVKLTTTTAAAGTSLQTVVAGYVFDGTATDDADLDGKDNPALSLGTQLFTQSMISNQDTFSTNARRVRQA